jgi:hypothetical protein
MSRKRGAVPVSSPRLRLSAMPTAGRSPMWATETDAMHAKVSEG